MLVIYGSKKAIICFDEFLIYCPSCEADSYADIMVVGKYFHLFFIPVFPYEKEMNCVCHKCGLKRYDISFDKKNLKNDIEIKHKLKYPLYTYTLSFIVISLILIVVLISH